MSGILRTVGIDISKDWLACSCKAEATLRAHRPRNRCFEKTPTTLKTRR